MWLAISNRQILTVSTTNETVGNDSHDRPLTGKFLLLELVDDDADPFQARFDFSSILL